MRIYLTCALSALCWGSLFGQVPDADTMEQLRQAKLRSGVQLQEYLNLQGTDSDADDRSKPNDLLAKLRAQIKRELELDLAVQRSRVSAAETRLADTKKRIDRSVAAIESLVDHELAFRLGKATHESDKAEPETDGVRRFETPQALLDHFDDLSVNGTANLDALTEQMTDRCANEMAGVVLQQIAFLSVLGQLGAQNGGFLGSSDGSPLLTPMGPSLMAAQCLEKHLIDERSPVADQAFQTLTQSSVDQAFLDGGSGLHIHRNLYQIAAGVLKSPRDFLRDASAIMDSWSDESDESNTESPPAAPKHVWDISVHENEAVAIDRAAVEPPHMELRLRKIEGRWKIDQMISDEMMDQITSGYQGIKASTENVSQPTVANTPPINATQTLEVYEVGGIVSSELFQTSQERLGLEDKKGETPHRKLLDGGRDLMELLRNTLRLPMQSCVVTPDKLALMIRHGESGHQEVATILDRLGGNREQRIELEVALVEAEDLPESIADRAFGPRPDDKAVLDEIWSKLDLNAEVFLQSIEARQGEIVEFSFGAGSKIRLVSRWEPNKQKIQLRFDEDLYLDPSRILSHVMSLDSGDTIVQILTVEDTYRWLIRATLKEQETQSTETEE